jgi:cytochrome c oxidase subunit 2
MIALERISAAASTGGLSLLGQASDSFWLPPPDSTTAGTVDRAFYFILWVSVFFFVLIAVLMIVFLVRYRQRPGVEPGRSPSHNTPLEVTWTVIPLLLVIVIFYVGFTGYMDMRLPPREAYEIQVVAQKWQWIFKYPTGHVDQELHVPVDQAVRLVMQSKDVIHSLFIPDFRVKMDVVPGRYTKTWFRATEPGQHLLLCTEYCGTGHSDMSATVIVHKPGEFERWLADADKFMEDLPPAERGEILYRRRGCQGCHSIDGTAKTGPSFKGIFGETHNFSNAPPTVVDENYLRESILEPSAKIREGYSDKMNSYKGQISDEEISDLIEFVKSLKK